MKNWPIFQTEIFCRHCLFHLLHFPPVNPNTTRRCFNLKSPLLLNILLCFYAILKFGLSYWDMNAEEMTYNNLCNTQSFTSYRRRAFCMHSWWSNFIWNIMFLELLPISLYIISAVCIWFPEKQDVFRQKSFKSSASKVHFLQFNDRS